ncbi:DNA polymerase II [Psychromonas sp. MME2]|uniref:DNA polymerase II n=1 Tax=Psychromonas sp. MME2 TaxID=3231033 RepID=UPI00339D2819
MSHILLRNTIEGLILSRQQNETAQGVELVLWLATGLGPCRVVIPAQRYVFLILQDDLARAISLWQSSKLTPQQIRSLSIKSFNQQPVTAIYTLNNKQFRALQSILDSAGIAHFEGDIKIADRYLMERFIYGTVKVQGDIEWNGRYWTSIAPKLSAGTASPQLKFVSLDIECSPRQTLYSIALTYANSSSASINSSPYSRVLMVGQQAQTEDINIQWVKDERALLEALQQWFIDHDPDLIIGWNVVDFDMQLLVKRAALHKMPLCLGRDQSPLRWLTHQDNPNQGSLIINGRVVLDGIDQLKNASWHFDSFSLQFVSESLLGESKLLASNEDKGLEIQRLFEQDPIALARYNQQDCLLVERIFAKAQLIEYAIQRACLTGLALDRRGASVAAFTNLYLPLLHRSGYIAPNIGDIEAQHSPGGFVMESDPGFYSWVLVLDFKSLYPSIMRTFKIDPMGMIEGLREDPSLSIPGFREARFSRSAHHLPGILDKLSAAREQAKRENNQPFQHAIKIIMNSLYGVLGSAGCRFHDTRLASSITLRGHQIMKETKQVIEAQGEQVIYGDTDSTFVWLKACKNSEQAALRGQTLEKIINHYWQHKLEKEYQLHSYLEIEFETCFRKFFMPTLRGSTTGSKKRYVGLKQTATGEKMLFKGLKRCVPIGPS